MGNQYDDTNRGAIWVNRKKEKPTDPDFTGEGNFGGEDLWISGWKRGEGESENAPVLRLSFRSKKGGAKKKQSGDDYYQSMGLKPRDEDAPY